MEWLKCPSQVAAEKSGSIPVSTPGSLGASPVHVLGMLSLHLRWTLKRQSRHWRPCLKSPLRSLRQKWHTVGFVDDKRVRDLNSARHFLLNPKRTTSTYGRSSVFLNTRTGAAARRAIRYALYNVFEIKNFETTLRKLQFDSLLRA